MIDALDLMRAGGVPYSSIRDEIRSGDLLLLHHSFVPSLYGLQIAAVQEWTGPFAHVALLDRVVIGGIERVAVWESVVPDVRMVPVTSTVEDTAGFFWIPMGRAMSADAIGALWERTGKGKYSKPGAVLAGINALPADEDADPRMWCAKLVNLICRIDGVDLGPRYVPTDMAFEAMRLFNAPLRYVRMDSTT
jgi:hypothetical protein